MIVVRNCSDSWVNVTQACVNGDDSAAAFIRKVLKALCENTIIFDIEHIITMFTYTVDVCINLISIKKDSNDVSEIVEIVSDYMLDKDIFTFL